MKTSIKKKFEEQKEHDEVKTLFGFAKYDFRLLEIKEVNLTITKMMMIISKVTFNGKYSKKITFTDFREFTNIAPTRITQNVKKMEELGLVKLSGNPKRNIFQYLGVDGYIEKLKENINTEMMTAKQEKNGELYRELKNKLTDID